jgi:hypothetical protein
VAAPKAEGSEAEGFAEELPDAPADTVRTRFAALAGRDAETVEEARALRDAWRAFARAHPDGPLAEEARVREIEAGELAWRLGCESADRQRARADAEAYLRREDAHGRERVRAALERLRREEK